MFKQATFNGPTRLLLHSVEGFGKTTLAAFFPKPAFICGERAFPRDLGFAPFHSEPKTWEEVLQLVHWLTTAQHEFESVVFDTFDWIDPLIQRYCCARDTGRKTEMNPKGNVLESIEDYGWSKGYVVVAEEVRRMLSMLDELQARRGMHVVILMHSWVKTFQNPAGDNFDRWQPKMHERSARVLVEWAENVLFGYFEVLASKDDPKDRKAKGVSTNRRILGARHSALYDAKNRFNLPDTVELQNPKDLIPYLIGTHLHPPPAHATQGPSMKDAPRAPDDAAQTVKQDAKPQQDAKPSKPSGKRSAKSEPVDDAKLREAYEANVAAKQPHPALAKLDEATQADVVSMLNDAHAKLGEQYASQVMQWIEQAGGDTKKIDAIFSTVTQAINQNSNQNSQTAQA